MAVQARHFSHDLLAQAAVGGSSLFLDDHAGCVPAPARVGDTATTVLCDFPRSDLACDYGLVSRKRPRLAAADHAPAAGGFLDDHRAGMPPAATGTGCLLPVPPFVDVRSRAVGSGAPSTSGRAANGGATATVSRGLLSSWSHRHGVEIDALVTLDAERMRVALEEARRRHARELVATVARAASGRLRASEANLQRALRRNAELEEKARQAGAECLAWMGVARSHEAVAAGLRATLDQLLQSPIGAAAAGVATSGGGCEGGEADDAQSCCFEAPAADHSRVRAAAASCKWCGGGEACVLLLPCRHLCLCRACDASVDACPVCAAAKNGSLHVLFS